ncbi:MAG: Crp/Fnr family transcriptional regulator [Bacteroidales bacterium]
MNNKYLNTCSALVQDSTCFELLTTEQMALIEGNQVTVNYKKGETICKQGSYASHILMLKQGLVKVFLEGNPRNLILTIIPSGQLIGLPSIFEGNKVFLYSVTTYVDSIVQMINIDIVKQLIAENAAFASRIINVLNENTAQHYGRFFSLMQKQLHGRMADILLCLSQRIFKTRTLHLPLSRADLAELTGMSTESVIRIIKDFKEDKLISVRAKTIEIIDFVRLERISEYG